MSVFVEKIFFLQFLGLFVPESSGSGVMDFCFEYFSEESEGFFFVFFKCGAIKFTKYACSGVWAYATGNLGENCRVAIAKDEAGIFIESLNGFAFFFGGFLFGE